MSVFLFSGHMIDQPDRSVPRFPPEFAAVAQRAIRTELETLHATKGDVGLCGGACGGDLLFAEACLDRGLRVELRLHSDRETFLEESVAFAGDEWVRRFDRVSGHRDCTVMTLGGQPVPATEGDKFERTNLWQLGAATEMAGAGLLHLIALWDGAPGDGPGGTAHMVSEVERRGGLVHIIPLRRERL